MAPSSPGMQVQLAPPDKKNRRTFTTQNRGKSGSDRPSPLPRFRHRNNANVVQHTPADAEPQYSDDDWYRIRDSSGNGSHQVSPSADARCSIRRDSKGGRRTPSCSTRDQPLQHQQSYLPYVTSLPSNYVGHWSDEEDSKFSSDSTRSGSSSDSPEGQEHTPTSAYAALSRIPSVATLLPSVLDHSWGKFCLWKQSAQYIIPPNHRIQSHHHRSILIESHDPLTSTTLIAPVHGYYPLACPFSLSHSCAPLPSIPRLICHLHTNHREPIYCPICSAVFPTFGLRDEHVRLLNCKYKEHFDVDGVDDRRLAKIARRDDPSMDEEGRWRRIWGICFAEVETPSPWVTEGVGLELAMVRDWMAAEGRACVEGCLKDKGEWDQEVVDAVVVSMGALLEGRVLGG